MKSRRILLFFFLVLATLSCSRHDTTLPKKLQEAPNGATSNNRPNAPTSSYAADQQVSSDLSTSLSAASNMTWGDVFANTNNVRASTEYIQLKNASVALLQQAGLLDSLKIYLQTDENDPRIILAAKWINDIYTLPKPIDTTDASSVGTQLIKCIGVALGVPLSEVAKLVGSMTLSEISTAIYAMGAKWFAGALVKAGIKAASGAGAAIMLGAFVWCMAFDDVVPNMDTLIYYAPVLPPTAPVITFSTNDFNSYISIIKTWAQNEAANGGTPVPLAWSKEDILYFNTLYKNDSTHPVSPNESNGTFQLQFEYYMNNLWADN